MENLSLSDRQLYQRQSETYRSRDRRHRSPRLPTPEDSRTSNDAFDGRSPTDTGPVRDVSLRPVSGDKNAPFELPHGTPHSRRDSRNITAPHSPPYRLSDSQKPSLPPLKTVLGDSISSPPRTPSPNGIMRQPSPREPSYAALTYKPPALYPNKKQRTELALDPASLYLSTRPSTTLEPQPSALSIRPSVRFSSLSGPFDSGVGARRQSNLAYSPPWGAQYQSQATRASSCQGSFETAANYYHTPEQTPTSTMLEPSFSKMNAFAGSIQDPFAREMRESFANSDGRPSTSRRSSRSGFLAIPQPPHDREPSRPLSYHQGMRHSIPGRDGYMDLHDIRYGHPDEQTRAIHGYAQTPYQRELPPFFMPSHYEYQHGKARKRSNLPKQSTEVMKTWFDQNIGNPYPSEEQKAVFSSATGISMTQVSNWFINHRRRCPELRDRRERSRGGRDGEP